MVLPERGGGFSWLRAEPQLSSFAALSMRAWKMRPTEVETRIHARWTKKGEEMGLAFA